jgi:hypothetical protein
MTFHNNDRTKVSKYNSYLLFMNDNHAVGSMRCGVERLLFRLKAIVPNMFFTGMGDALRARYLFAAPLRVNCGNPAFAFQFNLRIKVCFALLHVVKLLIYQR